jgi:predicted transposase/invertase (TIGR01784 family)
LKYLQAFDEMPEVFKGDEVFEKAFAIAELANMTREERQRYEQSLKNQWDTYAMFTTAEQKGEQRGERRGEQKGEQKALVKVAQALLQKGSDPALVAEVTGLPLDQIQKLQNPGASVKKLFPTIE